MDDHTALSSWHSASSGKPFSLTRASTFANGLEVEVYTSDPGLRYIFGLPTEHLRFRGVFKNGQDYQFVLEGQGRFYWRLFTENELNVFVIWWRNLPQRQDYPDGRLIQIQDYLESGSPEIVITFSTRYHRQVQACRDNWFISKEGKWHLIDERHLMASLAEQAVEFWVHNQNEPIAGVGMSHRMFLLYITPIQRHAS